MRFKFLRMWSLSMLAFSLSTFPPALFCLGISISASASDNLLTYSHSSFNEVVEVMQNEPYDPSNLPLIPIRVFKWAGNKLNFFVAQRSKEILIDKRDYRQVGVEKPIHPMGVGLTGKMVMLNSRWSGIFRGGIYSVVARASISQANPFKYKNDGSMQKRSTAMGIKVFSSVDNFTSGPTANAVFQNNLNGLLGEDGKPLNYLESAQTNEPGLSLSKIRNAYEVGTLFGVAFGSLTTKLDRMQQLPFINPQIRPVHSLAQFGEKNPSEIRVPIWVKISPVRQHQASDEKDFRLEIFRTLQMNGTIEYELFAADTKNSAQEIVWEKVGQLVFDRAILSKGVDQNLLFSHDALNSSMTEKKFTIPKAQKKD
ncbi:MAG: hypothetical protein H7061_11010 [Bdellovibrionaceae bacterium]|nr:hypothetical protein [Bdellovibrio sp.]